MQSSRDFTKFSNLSLHDRRFFRALSRIRTLRAAPRQFLRIVTMFARAPEGVKIPPTERGTAPISFRAEGCERAGGLCETEVRCAFNEAVRCARRSPRLHAAKITQSRETKIFHLFVHRHQLFFFTAGLRNPGTRQSKKNIRIRCLRNCNLNFTNERVWRADSSWTIMSRQIIFDCLDFDWKTNISRRLFEITWNNFKRTLIEF